MKCGVSQRSEVSVVHDGRAHARVQARLEARISTVEPDSGSNGERFFTVTSAITCDVADGGIRLAADSGLEPGRRVVVEIELGDGTSIACNGRVVWASRGDGASELGIAFDEALVGLTSFAS